MYAVYTVRDQHMFTVHVVRYIFFTDRIIALCMTTFDGIILILVNGASVHHRYLFERLKSVYWQNVLRIVTLFSARLSLQVKPYGYSSIGHYKTSS